MDVQLEVELWYDRKPTVDLDKVLAMVRETYAAATVQSADDGTNFVVEFPPDVDPDGSCPSPIFVAGMPLTTVDPDPARPDLAQTWTWLEASAARQSTTHTMVLRDVLGFVHPPGIRVGTFLAVLQAIIVHTGPVGTWWPVSDRALPPDEAAEPPIGGVVNVRMFQDAERPGHVLMDTLGLHAMGRPDAQIYFSTFDEGRIAPFMFGLARYIFDGGVFMDGHTVQGLEARHRWPVTHQTAMVGPERPVLNVDPS